MRDSFVYFDVLYNVGLRVRSSSTSGKAHCIASDVCALCIRCGEGIYKEKPERCIGSGSGFLE